MAQKNTLTAGEVLSAPQRHPGVPSPDGKLALYTFTKHVFGNGTVQELRVMDLEQQTSRTLSDDKSVNEYLWIPGTNDVAFLKSASLGKTEFFTVPASKSQADAQLITTFDAPVSALKLKRLADGGVAVVVIGLVGPDKSLFNDEAVVSHSTGRIFDNVNIRCWNTLYKPQRYGLWFNRMDLRDGEWKMAGELQNLILHDTLEGPAGCNPPGDPGANYDISDKGIIFAGQDPTFSKPDGPISSIPYFVPLDSFTAPPKEAPQILSLPSGVGIGGVGCVKFSPDGSTVGFIYVDAAVTHGARLFYAPLASLESYDVLEKIGFEFDDESFNPIDNFEFAGDHDSIIFASEQRGRGILSSLKLQKGETPKLLCGEGSVSGFYPLGDGKSDKLLVCSSSFIDISIWRIVSLSDGTVLTTFPSVTDDTLGLTPEMVSEFEYKAADDYTVHSFMVRPSTFDEKKTYPWVVIIHGGPVGAWADRWNPRWNAAAWAQQGYIVICPNITGSTGYGLKHARRIRGDWCGSPYRDVVNLVTHLETISYLDQSRGVIAGHSFGGLLISWMMGHDIIKKFCGVIWHCGIYNTTIFPLHIDGHWYDSPFDGIMYPWENPTLSAKSNPAEPALVRNWGNTPPTLIIHPEKDFRVPITEGLAAFKTLQIHGVPSRFLTFSDECHWIQKRENMKVWHETVWDWMRLCVDGKFVKAEARK